MKIERENCTIELTRQELFLAHEEYELLMAKEIVAERLSAIIDANAISADMLDAAVEAYLNAKAFGCEEDFCLEKLENAANAFCGGDDDAEQ